MIELHKLNDWTYEGGDTGISCSAQKQKTYVDALLADGCCAGCVDGLKRVGKKDSIVGN